MEQKGIYNAAIYCRLSKDDGTDEDTNNPQGESISIGTQKMMLEKYCKEQGFHIYGIYADDGYSGLNFNRPEFNRMLDDIDDGKVDLVITKDLSRLGRDYIQTGYYTDIYFSKRKVRYIAVNDGIDTDKEDNDIAPFKNILNDLYAKDLSRKVKSAKRQRAYNGYFISAQVPFGYKVNPTNKKQLIIDEEPAEIVKEMFQLAMSGYSTVQITKMLSERKLITPSKYKSNQGDTRFDRYNSEKDESQIYKWCNETVQTILKNRVYVGDMVNHKCEVINYKTKEKVRVPLNQQIIVEGTHEAIISREDFDRVQEMVKMRNRPKKHDADNLFKNLVFCAECGSRMTFEIRSRRSGKRGIMVCRYHFRNREKCQHNHYIYYSDLYEIVLSQIRKVAETIDSGELLKSYKSHTMKRNKKDRFESEKVKITTRLELLNRITKKLYEDYASNLLDSESYHKMLSEYQHEQKQLSGRLSVIQGELDKKEQYFENVRKLREVIKEYLNVEKLNANMLNHLIERIEIGHLVTVDGVKKQEINIIYRFVGTTL